jgi:hypothetical protein
MNSKNRRTLEAIFERPTRTNIKWDDLMALLMAVGATVEEREGSRVRFIRGTVGMALHRPHPGKEIRKYQVEITRKFLTALEVTP